MESIRKQLEMECRQTVDNLEGKMTSFVEKVYGELSLRSDSIERNSNKQIADTNGTIMKDVKPKLDRMLQEKDLKDVREKVDNLKRHVDTEFEQFQQYLRDEKKTFGEMYTKIRMLDKDFSETKTKLAGEFGEDFGETAATP